MNSKKIDEMLGNVAVDGRVSGEQNVRQAIATHQRDFPYERGEEAQVTRREFCNFLAVTSTALFVSSAGLSANALLDAREPSSYEPKKIEGAESLAPDSSLNFRYPADGDSAILIRSGDGEYYAYGQKCTHLACPVYFEQKRQRLECPCHEGCFDLQTGNVLFGPPPRPLDQIVLEVREGVVWAVGRKAGGHDRSV